jgi:transposase
MQITTIGLDIAKNVFQVHGIDAAEKVIVRKRLRRGQVLAFFKALPSCLIGTEAESLLCRVTRISGLPSHGQRGLSCINGGYPKR